MGKAVGWCLKEDLMGATGPLQAASGFQGGAEAAIHATREVFEDQGSEAVILVDASNAFNLLNRQVALHNVQRTCPQFATILINTYRSGSRLSVANCREIASLEGTTQGDNLGGHFYNQGTIPLQQSLSIAIPLVKQVWLADDATGAGTLANLKQWWDTIVVQGVKFGYHVNASKSWLIIKNSAQLPLAQQIFSDTAIQFSTTGKRHLGAAIGSQDFRTQYSREKIRKWQSEVERLSQFAKTEPHAAYAAYTHGQKHKFNYFLRTIPGMADLLDPLDRTITEKFLPSLLGVPSISDIQRKMFALPVRSGGLGIPLLAEIAEDEFRASVRMTAPLTALMVLQSVSLPDSDEVTVLRRTVTSEKRIKEKENCDALEQTLPLTTARAFIQAQGKGASSWLTALPLKEYGFQLNKSEFRDAIAIRYAAPLRALPTKCPCGQLFDIDHALNCKRGGFVIMRHNNILDFETNLLSQVCTDVEKEPALQPLDGEIVSGTAEDGARPDIRARGFWYRAQNAFFDIRLTNINAQSQRQLTTKQIFAKHEAEKKRLYNDRIINIEHGTFTPLVFSLNGVMSPECECFHKSLAQKIAEKTQQRYSTIMNLIRTKLSFLILRACLVCVRGSRPYATRTERNMAALPEEIDQAVRDAQIDPTD